MPEPGVINNLANQISYSFLEFSGMFSLLTRAVFKAKMYPDA